MKFSAVTCWLTLFKHLGAGFKGLSCVTNLHLHTY